MNVFVAILGLGLLVLVHEAGHFFTARAVGMTPRRFYVGFPPPLVRVRRKGIEYGIGAIPLGGYVKIPGMHRPAPSDLDTYFGPALAEAPQPARSARALQAPPRQGRHGRRARAAAGARACNRGGVGQPASGQAGAEGPQRAEGWPRRRTRTGARGPGGRCASSSLGQARTSCSRSSSSPRSSWSEAAATVSVSRSRRATSPSSTTFEPTVRPDAWASRPATGSSR